jgi:4'-phosphopantetheinyl transferase
MTPDGIDLWQFSLTGDRGAVNAALAFLCADERARFRRFGNSRLATAFALRRAFRRVILARYLEIEPLDVRTSDTPSGKPELSGLSTDLHFNASHSKDRGILAVARRFPVGADIERLRRIDTATLAARILSPSERLEFDHAEPEVRGTDMFRIWTGKEALVKGIGVGLDLRDLPLIGLPAIPAPAVWKLAEFGGRMSVHGQWHVCSMAPSEGYFISIAAPTEAAVTVIDAHALVAEQGL